MTAPIGTGFLDTSGAVSATQAAAARVLGYAQLIRSVGGSQPLTPGEFAAIEDAGLQVLGVYGRYRTSGWCDATGSGDAKRDMYNARQAGLPDGRVLALDIEGPTSVDWLGYLTGWLRVTKGCPYVRWVYLGIGAATDLTTAQLDEFVAEHPDVAWWSAGAWHANAPTCGFIATQTETNVTRGGMKYDVSQWSGQSFAPTIPAPPLFFSFEARSGESLGDRHARVWEEALAGGPMGRALRAAWYRSFMMAPRLGVATDIDNSQWSTSCLISQMASLHWAGWPGMLPRMGAGFFEVLGGPPPLAAGQVQRGDMVYWANTGTDGHIECVLRVGSDGNWYTAGGGGGADGTECSLRSHPNGADPFGRKLVGLYRPALMGLVAL